MFSLLLHQTLHLLSNKLTFRHTHVLRVMPDVVVLAVVLVLLLVVVTVIMFKLHKPRRRTVAVQLSRIRFTG
ncbi:hypothetical protein Hanom_Chr03g00264421 [Helianthus anomalus]